MPPEDAERLLCFSLMGPGPVEAILPLSRNADGTLGAKAAPAPCPPDLLAALDTAIREDLSQQHHCAKVGTLTETRLAAIEAARGLLAAPNILAALDSMADQLRRDSELHRGLAIGRQARIDVLSLARAALVARDVTFGTDDAE